MPSFQIDQGTPNANNVQLVLPTSLVTGITNVTTAGTRVVLGAIIPIKSILIKGLSTNTGIIYIGNNTVSSANGYPLIANEAVTFDFNNLNNIYIDSSVSGEGVNYLIIN